MAEKSLAAQAVFLGDDLRALRPAGMSQLKVAEQVGTSVSTVSRLECGQRCGPVPVLKSMLRLYGVPEQEISDYVQRAEQARNPGWVAEHNGTVPHWFGRYLSLEDAAICKRSYEPELVPGPMQIPCYTAAIAAAGHTVGTSDSAESLVAVRETRRLRLLDRTRPLAMTAVLNEAVIRRLVGGRTVMCAQLAYLVEMATRPNITLHVLPFAAQEHPAMTGAFTLLKFRERAIPTVYTEHPDGATYVDRPEDVRRYERTFAQLVHLALGEEETITMIEKAERSLSDGSPVGVAQVQSERTSAE